MDCGLITYYWLILILWIVPRIVEWSTYCGLFNSLWIDPHIVDWSTVCRLINGLWIDPNNVDWSTDCILIRTLWIDLHKPTTIWDRNTSFCGTKNMIFVVYLQATFVWKLKYITWGCGRRCFLQILTTYFVFCCIIKLFPYNNCHGTGYFLKNSKITPFFIFI